VPPGSGSSEGEWSGLPGAAWEEGFWEHSQEDNGGVLTYAFRKDNDSAVEVPFLIVWRTENLAFH
jgi:hypothetical protein